MSFTVKFSALLTGRAMALAARGWSETFEAGHNDGINLMSPQNNCVVAMSDDGETLGVVVFYGDPFGCVFVLQSYVVEHARGQGVYRAMREFLASHAARQGYGKVRSIVRPSNKRMVAVAQKLGFQTAGYVFDEDLGPLVEMMAMTTQGAA